ncbi:MAG TPA: mechanosensitive ion channel family protein [Mycobacteriales bacterium]|jgi:small-conductance mechanosensitive channel|nr:mechanosensitive ion channel family protein [Mycobacteriales bacterium]
MPTQEINFASVFYLPIVGRAVWVRGRLIGRPKPGRRPREMAIRAVEAMESRLHPDFRQAMWTGAIALVAVIVSGKLGPLHAHSTRRYVAIALAVVFAIFGVIAVRSAAGEASRVTALRGGAATSATVRLAVSLVGYLLILVVTLGLLNISMHRLLLGGAITGVVVGIAAQQPLSNVAAGIVMLVSRPFTVGDRVRVRSGALNGPFDGVMTSIGLVYSSIETDQGPLAIPNAALLGAAVGRIRDPAVGGIVRPGAGGAAQERAGRHTLIG